MGITTPTPGNVLRSIFLKALDQTVEKLVRALLSLNRIETQNILSQAIDAYAQARTIDEIVAPALEQIGEGWEKGNLALSQVYMSGRLCKQIVKITTDSQSPPLHAQPKIAIAVLDDYHSFGKKLVMTSLQSAGFDLTDFGAGVHAEDLAEQVANADIEILLISVLMLRAALQIKELRIRLSELGSNPQIIVGGAPFRFDPLLWREVGATAMGRTASDAIKIVTRLCGEKYEHDVA